MVRCAGCGHYHGHLTDGPTYWERCMAIQYGAGGGVQRCYCSELATAYLPPQHPKFSHEPAIASAPLPQAA